MLDVEGGGGSIHMLRCVSFGKGVGAGRRCGTLIFLPIDTYSGRRAQSRPLGRHFIYSQDRLVLCPDELVQACTLLDRWQSLQDAPILADVTDTDGSVRCEAMKIDLCSCCW